MKRSKAAQEAVNRYNKKAMISIAFRLHRETDAELIAIYEAIPNKAEWFRQALRDTSVHLQHTFNYSKLQKKC